MSKKKALAYCLYLCLHNCLKIEVDTTATFIKSYAFCPTMSHYVSVDFDGHDGGGGRGGDACVLGSRGKS